MDLNHTNTIVCRLCLFKGNTEDFIDIFVYDVDLVITIKECLSLSIAVNDALPKTICQSCLYKLNQWTAFKEHSWNSNRLLQLFHANDLKSIAQDESDSKEDILSDTINIKHESGGASNFPSSSDSCASVDKVLNKKKKSIAPEDESQFPHEYTCDYCPSTFSTFLEYIDHQQGHEHDEISFQCETCNKECSSRDELLLHENDHKENDMETCNVCGKNIKKPGMKQHMTRHTDTFKCDLCGLRCSAHSVLVSHKQAMHSTLKPYFCSICGKRFKRKGGLTVHAAVHSSKRDFPCPVKGCTYAARIKQSLGYHMTRVHPVEMKLETAAVCNECGKSFRTSRHLGDHLRRIHTKVKKFECRFCPMKFIAGYLLTAHVRTHTGERSFQCKVCEKTFPRADTLKGHMAIHQQRSSFSCTSCGKVFLTKKGRRQHNCTGVGTIVIKS